MYNRPLPCSIGTGTRMHTLAAALALAFCSVVHPPASASAATVPTVIHTADTLPGADGRSAKAHAVPATAAGLAHALSLVSPWSGGDLSSFKETVFPAALDHFLAWRHDDGAIYQRKIPWLFFENGCFARAEALNRHLVQSYRQSPLQKFFIIFPEPEDPAAPYVSFHVTNVARIGNEAWIVDPSVDASGPIALPHYLDMLAGSAEQREQLKIAVCSPDTFYDTNSCTDPKPYDADLLRSLTTGLLDTEWQQVVDAGLDPFEILVND